MQASVSTGELDYHWVGVSAISGITGVVAYAALFLLPHSAPSALGVPLIFAFALGITIANIGLYHILGGSNGSRLALIAAVTSVVGAAHLVAMLTVQLSVWAVVDQPDPALRAVWLGLDVAWDLYIGAGVILFALCMFGRRHLGAWLAVPGLLLGVLLFIFNIATFPIPPDQAGLVDVGPLVGLWFMAVYVRLGAASLLQKRQLRRSTASASS